MIRAPAARADIPGPDVLKSDIHTLENGWLKFAVAVNK